MFDSTEALKHLLKVHSNNKKDLIDDLGISITDLCMIANYLTMFQKKAAVDEIQFDHNSIIESFNAAINGSGEACLNMFMFTIVI